MFFYLFIIFIIYFLHFYITFLGTFVFSVECFLLRYMQRFTLHFATVSEAVLPPFVSAQLHIEFGKVFAGDMPLVAVMLPSRLEHIK